MNNPSIIIHKKQNPIQPPTKFSQVQPSSTTNPTRLTDQNLYHLCKTYGARALEWRRKFTGLLPEVNRRKLYERKGFPSIFVFAKKLAGLSEQQVRLTLNLNKRFENLPLLLALLVDGQVSINKLVRIASIVNSENEEFLANQIKILSSAAIETLVRDEKWAKNELVDHNFTEPNKNTNSLLQPINEVKSLHTQTFLQSNFPESNHQLHQSSQPFPNIPTTHPNTQALHLSTEVHQKLLELQQKGLDLNQLLLEFLQKREEEIAQKKEEISRKILQREEQKSQKTEEISDYILKNPLKTQRPNLQMSVRKILKEEYGKKCAIEHCYKSAEEIHHTLPFSISHSHDPKFLVPLCKEHHELQHVVNMKYIQFKKSNSQNSYTPQKSYNHRHMNHINQKRLLSQKT